MSPYKWKGAINGFLPGDIHILSIEKVDDLFHSRFDVKEKKYVNNDKIRQRILTNDSFGNKIRASTL